MTYVCTYSLAWLPQFSMSISPQAYKAIDLSCNEKTIDKWVLFPLFTRRKNVPGLACVGCAWVLFPNGYWRPEEEGVAQSTCRMEPNFRLLCRIPGLMSQRKI